MEPYNFYNFLSYGIKYLLTNAGFDKINIYPLSGIYHLLGKVLNTSTNLFFSRLDYRLRIITFVFEFTIKTIFLFIYLFLYFIDKLDKKKNWTTNYGCIAIK